MSPLRSLKNEFHGKGPYLASLSDPLLEREDSNLTKGNHLNPEAHQHLAINNKHRKQTITLKLDDEFEGSRTLGLEHSFSSGKPEYTKRGTIVIQSLKGNRAQFTPASSMSEEDIDTLKELAKKDGLYRVRIPLKDGSNAFVSSATRACAVVEAGLRDEITVNFDQSGEVLGVSIRGLVPACSGHDVPRANLTAWKTSVEVATTVSGPAPDTQTYIEKMKRDEQEKLKNQDGDNRSFLAKYVSICYHL
ncbi:ER membrane protein complex subunit 10-like [Elysia marginata]|uniref:ER membrane protein complex subunit 10 n=1 Tax=Elysia marginata TaxID=1093978 RepID=A0AAV4GI46_9GAST|nr:ER membrane protein complex subunit 10-like [Elysia marginata]